MSFGLMSLVRFIFSSSMYDAESNVIRVPVGESPCRVVAGQFPMKPVNMVL